MTDNSYPSVGLYWMRKKRLCVVKFFLACPRQLREIKSPNFLLKISYFYGTNDLVKLYDVYFAKLCQEQDAVECYHRLPTLKLMKLRISSVWSFVCLSRLI